MVVNRYIIIEKKDEVYLTIDAESDIRRELSEFFTFEVPGYKFMPQYRNRYWDGKIRLFKYAKGEISSKELFDQTTDGDDDAGGGSAIPQGIAEKNGMTEIPVLEFVKKILANAAQLRDFRNEGPGRPGMPQAGDTFRDNPNASKEAFQKIAAGEIYIPTPTGGEQAQAPAQEESGSEEEQNEARWHRGNLLNERVDRTTNVVLNRWKKLAGLE